MNLSRNYSIAILANIHQQNSDVLKLFDKLYILNSKGQCIYNDNLSNIKDHFVKCEFPLKNNQDPIEELMKVASLNSNNIFDDELVERFEDAICSQESQMEHCKLLDKISLKEISPENKSFNLFDVIILLRRIARDKLNGGWFIEIGFLICYLLSIILIISLFPSDIGTDPGCTEV